MRRQLDAVTIELGFARAQPMSAALKKEKRLRELDLSRCNIRVREQPLHILCRRCAAQSCGIGDLFELSFTEDCNAICEEERFAKIVCHQHSGWLCSFADVFQLTLELRARDGVERSERLVE